MASRPKRKFVTSREREIFLQQFHDNIEENEEHAFVADEDRDSEFLQSSASEVPADDNNEERSDIVDETENFDIDNIVFAEEEELSRTAYFP